MHIHTLYNNMYHKCHYKGTGDILKEGLTCNKTER